MVTHDNRILDIDRTSIWKMPVKESFVVKIEVVMNVVKQQWRSEAGKPLTIETV